tara:strand:+ start:22 stop:1080 length:1059 start_codon:yes stop_codon:yes gene_type:complete
MFFNNLIFILVLIAYSYCQNSFLLHFSNKNKFNLLSDNDFKKPQAFHEKSTFRLGGISIFFSLVLVFLYLFFYKNIFFIDYITFCTLFFILGLIDDLKINIRPKFRLLIMVLFLLILVIFNDFYIEKTGLKFLNELLEIDIFALFFVSLCFLFIINGSNLIDGFNGLLSIHSLIIFIILYVINFFGGNYEFAFILICTSLIILISLKFNFPNAKFFLGDSGAYLIGSLLAISIIKTSILNPGISPFFFCVLLFYLFFEVFFSFFRKIFFARQSPLLPDNKHLHMFLFKFLRKKKNSKLKSNYTTSIYINLIYLFLIMPAILFLENGLFCRYYFFFLLIVYTYLYKMLYEKVK